MATHSPILMAYPGADILKIDEEGAIGRASLRETSHYLLMREFMKDPEGVVAGMLRD
jgi:predicted ATPase